MSAPSNLETVFPQVDPARARVWPLQIIADAVVPYGVTAAEPHEIRLATQPMGTFGSFVAFTLTESPALHVIRASAFRSDLKQGDVDALLHLYQQLDVAGMEEDDRSVGLDGCTYVIDVNYNGLLKTIVRWSPEDTAIENLFKFADECCRTYQSP